MKVKIKTILWITMLGIKIERYGDINIISYRKKIQELKEIV